eukprot:533619_1
MSAFLSVYLLLVMSILIPNKSTEIIVGNFFGWHYNRGRATDYNPSGTGFQSGSDIQYPFADIHVKYGDVLVFTSRNGWPYDDLYLVPQEVYENCDFSDPYTITNTSSLYLASSDHIYCDPATDYWASPSNCGYQFTVSKWDDSDMSHNDDLFNTLINSNTLYFTSSFNWNANSTWKSCEGGLKLKVHIEQYPSSPTSVIYSPGGYYGWYYRSQYPDLYPLADLHVNIGDEIFFTSRVSTGEDLWLVPYEVYESCNFTDTTNQAQLAVSYYLRDTFYFINESCISGTTGCSNGWAINSYPYNELGGYSFIVQPCHIKQWGTTLYFASGREWDRWDYMGNHGCLNGIKLRVFVEGKCEQRTPLNVSNNAITTYYPGGNDGWYYNYLSPDLYPFDDLYVSVGDTIFFTSEYTTSEDLWLVPYDVYTSCNFTNTTNQAQLAVSNFLRGGYFSRNESCIPGDGDCSETGWIINSYPYNELGGYSFLVQDWYVEQYGNPLYFASARDWDRWDYMDNHGCLNGVKLRVFVEGICLSRAPIISEYTTTNNIPQSTQSMDTTHTTDIVEDTDLGERQIKGIRYTIIVIIFLLCFCI